MFLKENNEFVSITEFNYGGKELDNVGDGDSFCYLPCDIHGTPKLYYGDCHFYCALESLDDIVHSFYGGDIENLMDEDEINKIAEELWLDCISEPSRLYFGKYLVVGFDGHIPSSDYVKGVIKYIGGSPSDYVILYNDKDSVKELPCDYFLSNGINGREKPNIMKVPKELKEIYNKISSKRDSSSGRFPTNMTRAEYYWLTRQESREYDKIIIETINRYLRNNLV